MGLEGAGVVEAVGEGVTGIDKGARVAWTMVPGSYATHVLVPADKAVPLPEGITSQQGAAAMLQGMTAHYLATSTFPLRAGDACLVHAGAGGVGLLLTQVAKRVGARVFTTVSTEEKAKLSREAGADEVIRYTSEDFREAVRRLTSGAGVRVVYDSVGGDTFEKSLDCLAPRGMLVLFGQSSGAVPPFDAQAPEREGLAVPDPTHPRPLHGHPRGAPGPRPGCLRVDRGRKPQAPDRGDVPAGGSGARPRRAAGPPHDGKGAAAALSGAAWTKVQYPAVSSRTSSRRSIIPG